MAWPPPKNKKFRARGNTSSFVTELGECEQGLLEAIFSTALWGDGLCGKEWRQQRRAQRETDVGMKAGIEVKVAQSCPTLWDPMDYTVHGILQARILEWVAVPFSRGSSQPRDGTQVSAWQADSLPAEPQGSPRRLEWVAYPFSSRSSRPRNWTGISRITGQFFINWAIRKAHHVWDILLNTNLWILITALWSIFCYYQPHFHFFIFWSWPTSDVFIYNSHLRGIINSGFKFTLTYQAVQCHPACLTYTQSTSCETPGWMKHMMESRLLGKISITSDMQMIPHLWQEVKN